MTPLEIANKVFFQWITVRIFKYVNGETKKICGFGVLVGVKPNTGWNGENQYTGIIFKHVVRIGIDWYKE